MTKEYRKFKMTRKKADWVGSRDTTLRGTPMRVNNAFSDRMADDAQSMVYAMSQDVIKQVKVLFDTSTAKKSIAKKTEKITVENVAMDASISSQVRILMNGLIKKWEKRFNLFGNDFAEKMVNGVSKQSTNDLKKATEKLSGGLNIKTDSLTDRTKDIILASTNESSSLIKTIATDYTTEVNEAIFRSISTNTGSLTSLKEKINDSLQGKYKKYKNKAKNVALDQTRKAYSNIATSRMQDVGLDEFIWRHSAGSQTPRSHHKDVLNGNVYSISNPPVINTKTGVKGLPAQEINCKCYLEPVITFG